MTLPLSSTLKEVGSSILSEICGSSIAAKAIKEIVKGVIKTYENKKRNIAKPIGFGEVNVVSQVIGRKTNKKEGCKCKGDLKLKKKGVFPFLNQTGDENKFSIDGTFSSAVGSGFSLDGFSPGDQARVFIQLDVSTEMKTIKNISQKRIIVSEFGFVYTNLEELDPNRYLVDILFEDKE